MGSPEFALPSLKALIRDRHEIVCVLSQPPKPKGRGKKVEPSHVHAFAMKHSIPVHCPESLKKDAEFQIKFQSMNIDVAVVAAYGLILPKRILEAPRHGCLNIHASLLPRWRGASPIQHAVLHGDSESGVCIMQMDEGLDTGPIVGCRSVAMDDRTTAKVLHDQLSLLGAEMIKDCLRKLLHEGNLPSNPQSENDVTYAPVLDSKDGLVDWNNSATEIDRKIRALNPWPGVWTTINGKRIKLLRSVPANTDKPGITGELLDRDGHFKCGKNSVIRILKLQPEGKREMGAGAAINGKYLEVGAVMGG